MAAHAILLVLDHNLFSPVQVDERYTAQAQANRREALCGPKGSAVEVIMVVTVHGELDAHDLGQGVKDLEPMRVVAGRFVRHQDIGSHACQLVDDSRIDR